MLATLFDRMGASSRSPIRPELTRASSSESMLTTITADASSNVQSSSSTPPTSIASIGDSASVSSTSLKVESINPPSATENRSRRNRTSVGTYNVKVLSGTAIHAPKKYCKNIETGNNVSRRRTISGDTLVDVLSSANSSSESVAKDANRLVRDGIEALDLQWSVKKLPQSRSQIGLNGSPKKSAKQLDLERRKSARPAGERLRSLTKKLSVLGKRSRDNFEAGMSNLTKIKRELRNLADTPEFAKIETKPVVHEVWSNGKLVKEEPPHKKKKKVEVVAPTKEKVDEAKPAGKKQIGGKKQKIWLSKGLYAGQSNENPDWFSDSTDKQDRNVSGWPASSPRNILPVPMGFGRRMVKIGRDFKLPFDVCSPLPPGQSKPEDWRKTSSNRFVGEAASLWRKEDIFDSFSSKCVCIAENGCDERCQNRIMLYECNDTICNVGRARCANRAFTELQERRKEGGKYRIGVEVLKTVDRGYGVRSNRCFEPHQIIVEYTGEIITEDECDRRMNEDYKKNECYYLMSFDQNMILDGTKGSIARFVNHSCKPNCRMVKWLVNGKPRMALFAGDNPIMTGDELTYDYNFDPFSAKNVQECRCGSDNCRGVLGPKPKEVKPVKESIKEAVKAGVKAGKRKLKELLAGDDANAEDRSPKKRKIKEAKGIKRSASSASMKVAKDAAKAVKRSVSEQLLNARKAVSSRHGGVVTVKKTTRVITLNKSGKVKTKVSSRNSSLTIIATDSAPESPTGKMETVGKRSVKKNIVRSMYPAEIGSPSRNASRGTIRVITARDE